MFPIHPRQSAFSYSSINANGILVPVVPLMFKVKKILPAPNKGGSKTLVAVNPATESVSPVTQADDVNDMLFEQLRGLQERIKEMSTNFPKGDDDIVAAGDAKIVLVAEYAQFISQVWQLFFFLSFFIFFPRGQLSVSWP